MACRADVSKRWALRTGVSERLLFEFGESFPHPHNAYLQWTLDNGVLGLIPVLMLFYLIVVSAKQLFLDNDDVLYVATGGLCLSFVLAFLLGSMGSQTFYPREGAVGMWCAIGLMWRVSLERSRLRNPHAAKAEAISARTVPVPSTTYSKTS